MPRLRLILLVCDLVASAEPEAAEQSGGFLEEIRSDGSMEAVSSIGAEGVFAAQDWEASEDSDSAESEDSAAPPYPDRTALPHYDFENDFAPASLLATGETHQQSGCLDGLYDGDDTIADADYLARHLRTTRDIHDDNDIHTATTGSFSFVLFLHRRQHEADIFSGKNNT
eukprot:g17191.t1